MREFISDRRALDFVKERTGARIDQDCAYLGVVVDGIVRAGVVFNHYTGHDIHVTVAGDPKAFTPIFIRRCGDYIFGELKCCRFSITTEQIKVVGLALRLGGQREGVKRDQFGPGRHGIMVGVLKDEFLLARRLKPSLANGRSEER